VLLPTGAGEERTLPLAPLVNGQFGSWFPDGQRLLLLASEPGRPQRLFERSLEEDATPRPVTPEGVVGMPGGLTPDGRYVGAVSFETDPPTVSLYPVDGGDPVELPAIARGTSPAGWNENGSAFFVTRGKGKRTSIHSVDVKTGEETLLHEIEPVDPAGIDEFGYALVSADGRAYAYTVHRTLSTLFLVEGLR
jgi:Tol biopolymer transport system component